MHKTIENLNYIQNQINSKILKLNINNYKPKIIAISKTFKISHILPLIEHGHMDFGENKVQEAVEKWTEIKNKNKNIKLHMVGRLQTNKVKFVLPLFDFIHSLDNLKLAKKISEEQKKYENKPKIFIQINIGNESQKSGIDKNQLSEYGTYVFGSESHGISENLKSKIKNKIGIPNFKKHNGAESLNVATSVAIFFSEIYRT